VTYNNRKTFSEIKWFSHQLLGPNFLIAGFAKAGRTAISFFIAKSIAVLESTNFKVKYYIFLLFHIIIGNYLYYIFSMSQIMIIMTIMIIIGDY